MSQTAQTWLIVIATLGAAFLGAIVAYIGAAHQQRKQAERDAEVRREQDKREDQLRLEQQKRGERLRLEQGIAEILSAAQDILSGVQWLREAHSRRTHFRYYVRLSAMLLRDYPMPEKWADLLDLPRLRALLSTALEADRYQLEESRMIAVDAATVLAPRLNRYFSIVAILTLGQDEQIAAAVRELNPAVVAVTQSFGVRKREVERVTSELQRAMERFREMANQRLASISNDSEQPLAAGCDQPPDTTALPSPVARGRFAFLRPRRP